MSDPFPYEPDSFAGPLPPGRIAEFERIYTQYLEVPEPLQFPQDYTSHLAIYHGGVPQKQCFRTPSGTQRALGRFLNFLKASDLTTPAVKSWRGGGADIRLDYSLYYVGPMGPTPDALAPTLLPFAGLDTAGHDCRSMARFDLLCFDFQNPTAPSIVTWSVQEPDPHRQTEFVAHSFSELLALIYICPPNCAFSSNTPRSF
jgi:hypothetical protein